MKPNYRTSWTIARFRPQVALLILSVCLLQSASAAAERGEFDTLRLLYWQAPTVVNPHLSIGTKDLSASRIVYETLASFDAEGNMVPFLAAEIPSLENGGVAADGRSVTWKLKEDVKWADGEPFAADDVLFTGEPLVVDDYQSWEGRTRSVTYSVPIRSIMAVPLKSRDEVVGVLGMSYQVGSPHAFGDDEVELLGRFGELASLSLDNARLHTAARQARAAADAASEAKSSFLANVSHELRTPLTSILGFARIIQGRLTERVLPLIETDDRRARRAIRQVQDNLGIILAEGQRLTTLINNVLDLEKIRSSRRCALRRSRLPARPGGRAGRSWSRTMTPASSASSVTTSRPPAIG